MLLAKPQSWRDPACARRATERSCFLLVLLPAGISDGFNPGVFFDASSLRPRSSSWPPLFPPPFTGHSLQLLVRVLEDHRQCHQWLVLALVLAIPLSLLANRTLSISRLGTGTMGYIPAVVRAGLRWGLASCAASQNWCGRCSCPGRGLGDTAVCYGYLPDLCGHDRQGISGKSTSPRIPGNQPCWPIARGGCCLLLWDTAILSA